MPEWTQEGALYIFLGIELFAFQNKGGKWLIKNSRCNKCGQCCMGLKKHSFPLINGQCIHLKKEPGKDNKEWLCGFGMSRPFGCCVGTSNNRSECTERFEEVE